MSDSESDIESPRTIKAIDRKAPMLPYAYSRESRGVGRSLKTLYGKAKKVYHRVKDYLPSAEHILSVSDALAKGGAIQSPHTAGLYGASHIIRQIPGIGKHLAVPFAVAGVAPGALKRLNAMRRGAGFLPPGVGFQRPNYTPGAEVITSQGSFIANPDGSLRPRNL